MRVLLPLVLDDLLHLLEHGLVLFIQSGLVQGKVLVVQIEAFVLLLDLLRQRLAEGFDVPVQLQHNVGISLLLGGLLGVEVGCLEGFGRLFQSRE